MQQKILASALIAAMGAGAMTMASAAPADKIETGRLGRLSDSALVDRLQLGAGSALVNEARVRTARGTTRTRERQTWHGVPVYGSSLVVERDRSGTVLRVEGEAQRNLAFDLPSVQPRITASQAQAALKARVGHGRVRSVENASNDLLVYAPKNAPAKLVYRSSYFTTFNGKPTRPTALVDANTGQVIRQWDGLTNGRRPPGGTSTPVAATAYGPGGNPATGYYNYDGSGPGLDPLRVTRVGNVCYTENADVATYNIAGSNRLSLWSFGCGIGTPAGISSGDDVNGAASPINDAHHFGSVVHDMYTSWFAAPPLTTDGTTPMRLDMLVHYGTNYGNAFWNGRYMVFGDGDSYFYPFVVLDITGHEISHGFTEQHSGLEYYGQSGGMNEAFSDMAGEAAKFFDRGSNNFLVGDEIIKPETVPLFGPSLRDMCTPSNDGLSIDTASQYYDGLDVHYSSGVYNRAFCTLAQTPGWDTRKAFEVFHDANALYWGPLETFDSGACAVEQAAVDRGYPSADVTAAFAQVEVACAP
jgi:pseudolysin/vibriolysin